MRKRTGMRPKKEEEPEVGDGEGPLMTKTQKAQAAMAKRAREASKKDQMANYYYVIYGFVGICVLAVGLSLFSPKQKFSEINAIDDSAILVHNGYGYQFKQGGNSFFQGKTLADAKQLFMNGLSDSDRNHLCKSSLGTGETPEEITVPETYDWRTAYPDCVQEVRNIGHIANCTSSYAYATISAAEDKICMQAKEKVQLSTQEILDCDVGNSACTGGNVNKVLMFGQSKGFIYEECMEPAEKVNECDVDQFESNQCRLEEQVHKVYDYCIAAGEENIKREIMKNGPVVGQMTPYTDFLAYKDGTYHKTPEAFKFNGIHILKIIGWGKSLDGSTEWIVENSWGSDWGENGYAKVASGKGDTMIETHAVGFILNHLSMADAQEAQANAPPPEPISNAQNPLGDIMAAGQEKAQQDMFASMGGGGGSDDSDDGDES